MKYSNCEPVLVFDTTIVELHSHKKLKEIYHILMTYRFPMSLNLRMDLH